MRDSQSPVIACAVYLCTLCVDTCVIFMIITLPASHVHPGPGKVPDPMYCVLSFVPLFLVVIFAHSLLPVLSPASETA